MKLNKFRVVAALSAIAMALVTNASALTINSPGVVGVYNGKLDNADVSTEIIAAQHLLDMLKSTHDGAWDAGDQLYLNQTSDTEYWAKLEGGAQNKTTDVAGDYGFAKYDGQNAGYVLFYLGGALASSIIPNTPDSLWTTSGQYALSHVTVFGTTPTNRVPDSGTTAALLGAGLVGLSLIARRRRTA